MADLRETHGQAFTGWLIQYEISLQMVANETGATIEDLERWMGDESLPTLRQTAILRRISKGAVQFPDFWDRLAVLIHDQINRLRRFFRG